MSIVFKGKKGAGTITIERERAVVGTRSTCDLVVDDPMVAEEHFALEQRGGRFYLVDLRTSSGTYLNGLPVEQATELPLDGEQVIVFGVSRLLVTVDEGGGGLTANLKEQSFFYDKKDDPLKWSQSEVEFGRFSLLKTSNLVLLAVTVLLLFLCFFDAVEEPLVNPGPLLSYHGADYLNAHRPDLLASFEAQGIEASDCRLCHEGFRGTPAEKCASCHEPIFSKSRHPFDWEGLSCQPCHVDHRGVLSTDMTQVDTSKTCAQCHDEDQGLTARALSGVTATEAYVRLSYTAFPHASHSGLDHRGEQMTCTTCHAFGESPEAASVAEGRPRREFARIKYESCQECHQSSGRAGTSWDFSWHGSEPADGEGSRCSNCHEQPLNAERKTVSRVKREDTAALQSSFALTLRTHSEEMAAHRDIGEDSCHLCHRDEKILTARLDDRRFLHGLHMTSVNPASPFAERVEGECRKCHDDVVSGARASSLTDGPYHHGMTTCSPCHEPGSLLPERPIIDVSSLERRNAFPHAFHLDRSKPGLEAGCVSCHPVSPDLRDSAPPQTTAEAMSCTPCHQEHRHVGGGDCSVCHPKGDISLLGGTVTKLWPLPNRFSHKTRGHDGDCTSCHGPLDQSQSLLDVPIPDESHPSCVQCHVTEKARFHFGR